MVSYAKKAREYIKLRGYYFDSGYECHNHLGIKITIVKVKG